MNVRNTQPQTRPLLPLCQYLQPCERAMPSILDPTRTRRLMTEMAGVRRYHRGAERAVAAARGGVLWVAAGKGWRRDPDHVARVLASIERRERP